MSLSARVPSLRGRLLLFLLLPLLAVLGASIVFDYRAAMESSTEAYDHALAASATALASQIRQDHERLRLEIAPSAETVLRTDAYDKVYYAVLDGHGALLAGDADLAALVEVEGYGNPRFYDGQLEGKPLRVVSYRVSEGQGGATVLVAETTRKRERAIARTVATMIWSNLMLIGTTLVLVYAGVKLALAPLLGLGAQIARRMPGDLRPVARTPVPAEAQPLVDALNQLMANLHGAHEAQQAFLTAAAHQMRTPLAGLQAQIELAAEQASEAEKPRMEQMRQATRRLSHLTHQMLALARSSPEADVAHEFEPLNLASLCETVAGEFLDAALAKTIDLGVEMAPASVRGSPWLLRELLSNLLDNAIAYSPAGSHVTCRCGMAEGSAYLEVEDDGPGIPEALRERVFDRFYRGSQGEVPGAGLGLAIVREVAERHGAHLQLRGPVSGKGACFRVNFAGAEAAPARPVSA